MALRAVTFARIAKDITRSSRKQVPVVLRDFRRLAAAAQHQQSRPFVRLVLADLVRYGRSGVRPIEGQTLERAAAAARWIAKAHDATGREGVSYGYFPLGSPPGWRAAYPETTGYTITTLLAFAAVTGDEEYRQRALQMAHWELQCQMPCGGIPGGELRQDRHGVAVAFNTGMVLQGLLAAHRETHDAVFAEGARRAADFLLGDMDEEGRFRSHGPFVTPGAVKTYTCLCAWPLYRAGQDLSDERYLDAARRVGDASLREQNSDGWFARNCLSRGVHAPLLHTIAYTLQGLLELGILSGEERYTAAVVRAMERLLPHCEDGFLHARWYRDWEPAAFSSCLTGAAQVAVVCYRLADHMGVPRYRAAAEGVLNYLKALQSMDCDDPNLVGAIGGSFPLVGAYMTLGFPEWATKYYLDALLMQECLRRRETDASNVSRQRQGSARSHDCVSFHDSPQLT